MRTRAKPKADASPRPDLPGRLPHGHHGLPREVVEENQRSRILAAIPEVMAEHGYARASVRHMIEHSGVSRRTFYLYFDNKEDAFRAAYDAAFERLHAELARAYRTQAHWPERVRAAIAAALKFAAADSPTARLLAFESLAAGPAAAAHHYRCFDRLAAELRAGREHVPGPTPLASITEQALIAAICGVIAERLLMGDPTRLPELAPQLTELVLTPYLGAQEARLVALGRSRPRFVDCDAKP